MTDRRRGQDSDPWNPYGPGPSADPPPADHDAELDFVLFRHADPVEHTAVDTGEVVESLAAEDEPFSGPDLSVRLDGLAEWVPCPQLRDIRNDRARRSD
jgi:hypothetical protein